MTRSVIDVYIRCTLAFYYVVRILISINRLCVRTGTTGTQRRIVSYGTSVSPECANTVTRIPDGNWVTGVQHRSSSKRLLIFSVDGNNAITTRHNGTVRNAIPRTGYIMWRALCERAIRNEIFTRKKTSCPAEVMGERPAWKKKQTRRITKPK